MNDLKEVLREICGRPRCCGLDENYKPSHYQITTAQLDSLRAALARLETGEGEAGEIVKRLRKHANQKMASMGDEKPFFYHETERELFNSAADQLATQADEIERLKTQPENPVFHRCVNDSVRPGPQSLCSACPPAAICTDFDPVVELERLREEVERYTEALTPSGETKAAYHGEVMARAISGEVIITWDAIKQTMKLIRKRADTAALATERGEKTKEN